MILNRTHKKQLHISLCIFNCNASLFWHKGLKFWSHSHPSKPVGRWKPIFGVHHSI